ncbi:hypothetical protein [Staphylococcus aureus]|uniref:hypothetical protein n=1 Tax=Staphylococcus aureus TaxID=1280 RepID=UPI00124BC91E|nr:hypothetical protein [Staphylococcus aureus]
MTVVLDFLYYSISNQQLVSNKTILNQKHNQYHNPAGVDYGPQHGEFRKEILQTMQVGVGPQHREIGSPISTNNASWAGPQHRS